MTSGLAQEIILIDKDEQRANGEAMDLNHGLSFVPPVEVRAGSYADCEGIVRQLPAQLSEAEAEQVRQSAAKLKDIQDSLKG
jgi:malate/lactate dehydrogenase